MTTVELLVAANTLALRLHGCAFDDHGRETARRALAYTLGRIRMGVVTTHNEMALSMAAFSEGFCAGYHFEKAPISGA